MLAIDLGEKNTKESLLCLNISLNLFNLIKSIFFFFVQLELAWPNFYVKLEAFLSQSFLYKLCSVRRKIEEKRLPVWPLCHSLSSAEWQSLSTRHS